MEVDRFWIGLLVGAAAGLLASSARTPEEEPISSTWSGLALPSWPDLQSDKAAPKAAPKAPPVTRIDSGISWGGGYSGPWK